MPSFPPVTSAILFAVFTQPAVLFKTATIYNSVLNLSLTRPGTEHSEGIHVTFSLFLNSCLRFIVAAEAWTRVESLTLPLEALPYAKTITPGAVPCQTRNS